MRAGKSVGLQAIDWWREKKTLCYFFKLYDLKNNLGAIKGIISDTVNDSTQLTGSSFTRIDVINVMPVLAHISDWM